MGTQKTRHVCTRAVAGAIAALLVLGLVACAGPFPQSTFRPTSDLTRELDDLYNTIFWFAVFVFVVVEALLVYAVIRFRARPDAGIVPKQIHGHTVLEIAWTLAPAVILVFIAVPTIESVFRTSRPAPDDAIRVEVIGHQWWWEYRYPDLGIVTANEFHIPVGRPVELSMTSRDVIHSHWAPRVFGKRDVILGRNNRLIFTADSTGMFLGQCAEFCGASHAKMSFRVFVDDTATFDAWVNQEHTLPPPADSLDGLERQGLQAFTAIREPATNSCLACHRIEGVSGGVLGPDLTHVGGRTSIAGAALPNDATGLAQWLRDPFSVKPGSLMPDIDLTEDEIQALVAYLQALR